MAILKSGNDECEVRIKRYPEKTYFDEYVKIGDREKSSATSCDRYIIGEDGVRYTIEVTLRKGFDFGDFERVRAKLCLPGQRNEISFNDIRRPAGYEHGTKTELITELQYADVTVGDNELRGARFSFRKLLLDEEIVNETDVMGIGPESLGHFSIKVFKFRWKPRQSLGEGYEKKVAAESEVAKPTPQLTARSVDVDGNQQFLWDAQKVYEESFKDGIAYDISLVGGIVKQQTKIYRRVPVIRGTCFLFNFYYRTSEFLEQTGIAKYPPPLYAYAWKDLDKTERQIALKDLQSINKEHVLRTLEAKTGKKHAKFSKSRGKDEPKEWRAWSKMSEWEKEEAFESLRISNKAYERGETMRQYESRNGEIILLVNEDEGKPKKDKISSRANLASESEKKSVQVESGNAVQQDMNAKNEPIDIEALTPNPNPAPVHIPTRNTEHREATPTAIENIDGRLERKRARAKALAEEIEMEERIVRLKRERRALEEEIEVAESKKRQRH